MRYENLMIDTLDRDFLNFTNEEYEGNVVLIPIEELVTITNTIRKEQGNTDLVGSEYDNEVYYNFYLMFNALTRTIRIQAVCNYGEKDDEVWYQLPMTQEEERNTMFTLLRCFIKELYEN